MAKPLKTSEDLGLAFLGLELYRLLQVIDEQGDEVLARRGLAAPSKAASLMLYLDQKGAASVSEVGQFLSMSHQLVALRVSALVDAGLLTKTQSIEDRRRSLLTLSAEGKKQASVLKSVSAETATAYRQIFKEIDQDLYTGLLRFRQQLESLPLHLRLAQEKGKRL